MWEVKSIIYLVLILNFINCKEIKKLRTTIGQAKQKFQEVTKISIEFDYYLYLPKEYNDKDKFPLILFLHGSGERGSNLKLIKKWGLPKMVDSLAIPFIVISPQCPANVDWDLYALKALIDNTIKNYKVDVSRIYLTGLSMGGYATYEMAIMYPDLFAAIAPMSSGGRTFRAKKISHIPTWAFHGAKDEVVPLKLGKDMVDAINKAGGNAKFTVFPDAKHVCWDRIYSNRKLYNWFLSNKK